MFAMPTAAGINALAETWAGVMLRASVDSAVLLAVLMAIWLPFRKRCSSRLTIGLFLLVFLKLALPVTLPLPEWWARVWPSTYLSLRSIETTVADEATRPRAVLSAAAADDLGGSRTARDGAPADANPVISDASLTRPVVLAGTTQPTNVAKRESTAARPQDPPARLSRRAWLMLAWAVLVVLLATRLLLQQVRFSRRLRHARPVEPAALPVDWHALVERAGLKRRIPLLETDQVSAPAVFGLLRPHVLLPPGLAGRLAAGPLAWVLLHELMHIRRGDLWMRSFERVVRLVYFFHPAAWLAGRIIDVHREYACDDAALAACRETPREECGRGLIAVIEEAQSCRAVASGATLGLFGSRSFLRSRILRILDTRRSLSVRVTAPALLLLAAVALISLPYVRAQLKPGTPARKDSSKEQVSEGTASPHPMEVIVVEAKTRLPEPDVIVRVEDRGGNLKFQGRTDRDGKYVVPATWLEPGQLRLHVEKAGFVPLAVEWNGPESLSSLEIPAHCSVSLERGTAIGGVVEDQHGQPIQGANITLMASYAQLQHGIPVIDLRYETRSDASGRWQCDMAPAGADRIFLAVKHPDYEVSSYPVINASARLSELKDGKGRTVLVRRSSDPIAGKVVDAGGRPIANAVVEWNRSKVQTDAEGGFTLRGFAVGAEAFWVRAPGFVPVARTLTATEAKSPVRIVLQRGQTIAGRVVDHRGRPVPGASIMFESGLAGDPSSGGSESDAEGKFSMALPSIVPGRLIARHGMFHQSTTTFSGNARDVSLVLPDYDIAVKVRAIDGASGEPIPNFHVLTRGPETFRHTGANGRFTLRWPNWRFGDLHVRVEAAGYATSQPQVVKPGREEVDLTFRLRKAPPISVIVKDSNGRPVGGAEYAIAQVNPSEFIDEHHRIQGDHVAANHSPYTPPRTDATGRITFSDMDEPMALLVAHPLGVACPRVDQLRPRDGSPVDMVLQSWGKVEGLVIRDGLPVRRASVSLEIIKREVPSGDGGPYLRTTTDAAGRFSFDHLAPCWVTPRWSLGDRSVGYFVEGSPAAVEVKLGQTVTLELSSSVGGGRTVIGKIDLPPALTDESLVNSRNAWLRPGVTRREDTQETSREVLDKRRFALARDQASHHFTITPDGTFRVEGVLPGRYEFGARLYKVGQGNQVLDQFGDARRTVTIPPAENRAERDNEAFDLGAIPFEALPKVKAGDLLPDQPLRLSDGARARFSDFRGKHLVLVFWRADDKTTRDDSEALRRLRERFRRVDGLAMVGVCLDRPGQIDQPASEYRGWDWPQGTLANGESHFEYDCRLRDLPSVWLIGPDGKILARDLRGDAIRETVVRALTRT